MSLTEIQTRIETSAREKGRDPADIQLVAISKVQPEDRVRAVLEEGHRTFGENRVQEAETRWTPFKEEFENVSLHLVGPLQTNKARVAFGLFDAIHSLDRPKLANTFARLSDETGHCPRVFIQVNTGEEPQKAGILPSETDGFVAEVRKLGLPLDGLMCIPPVDEEPALHFALLAKIAERNGLSGLSMGMSADFEAAIGFGATHIRVGSAIFGARQAT
ncbi:MAG: YggS family pyridoxal phosphate-dependent enzyme [Pseudomonadota bacterium]